jgi:hypothetical protein
VKTIPALSPLPGDFIVNMSTPKTLTRDPGPVQRWDAQGDALPVDMQNPMLGTMQPDERALVVAWTKLGAGARPGLAEDHDEALVLCCDSGLLGWVLPRGLTVIQRGGQP